MSRLPPWDNAFSGTAAHNSVMVDGRDQMTRAGRFLWLDWAQGRVRHRGGSGVVEYWEGEHDGYSALGGLHRRALLLIGDSAWAVVDDLLGSQVHKIRLQWLLPDCPYEWKEGELTMQTSAGPVRLAAICTSAAEATLVRAGEPLAGGAAGQSLRGWRAPHYAAKEPALSLVLASNSALPLRLVSLFLLGDARKAQCTPSEAVITTSGGPARISLAAVG